MTDEAALDSRELTGYQQLNTCTTDTHPLVKKTEIPPTNNGQHAIKVHKRTNIRLITFIMARIVAVITSELQTKAKGRKYRAGYEIYRAVLMFV